MDTLQFSIPTLLTSLASLRKSTAKSIEELVRSLKKSPRPSSQEMLL